MMINTIPPEIEARFPDYVREWKGYGLSTEPADRPRAEDAIFWMYEQAGLKKPRIVWAQSPLASGLARAITKEVQDSVQDSVRDSVRNSVRASVQASVRNSVWNSVRASVQDSVRDSVQDSVGASVQASVPASVWNSVRASVWASVRNSVRNSVRASVRDSVQASVWLSVRASVQASVYGQHEASWLAFYRVFSDMGLRDQTRPLHGLSELCQSAGSALPHEDICWISERHNICKLNGDGVIHCETGPAIAYPDGFEIYAWNGQRIPENWIKDPSSIGPKEALTWRNADQRAAAMEIAGMANVLREAGAKTVNRHKNPLIGELVQVTHPSIGTDERFVIAHEKPDRTGRVFGIPVPPSTKSALEGQTFIQGLPGPVIEATVCRT
ncbi:MAG: DUF6745 domain-containing protein [Pseudomonadota bacterium]